MDLEGAFLDLEGALLHNLPNGGYNGPSRPSGPSGPRFLRPCPQGLLV